MHPCIAYIAPNFQATATKEDVLSQGNCTYDVDTRWQSPTKDLMLANWGVGKVLEMLTIVYEVTVSPDIIHTLPLGSERN